MLVAGSERLLNIPIYAVNTTLYPDIRHNNMRSNVAWLRFYLFNLSFSSASSVIFIIYFLLCVHLSHKSHCDFSKTIFKWIYFISTWAHDKTMTMNSIQKVFCSEVNNRIVISTCKVLFEAHLVREKKKKQIHYFRGGFSCKTNHCQCKQTKWLSKFKVINRF